MLAKLTKAEKTYTIYYKKYKQEKEIKRSDSL